MLNSLMRKTMPGYEREMICKVCDYRKKVVFRWNFTKQNRSNMLCRYRELSHTGNAALVDTHRKRMPREGSKVKCPCGYCGKINMTILEDCENQIKNVVATFCADIESGTCIEEDYRKLLLLLRGHYPMYYNYLERVWINSQIKQRYSKIR